jgi:hypothetical protein
MMAQANPETASTHFVTVHVYCSSTTSCAVRLQSLPLLATMTLRKRLPAFLITTGQVAAMPAAANNTIHASMLPMGLFNRRVHLN